MYHPALPGSTPGQLSAPAAVLNLLPVPDTVRGPSPDLGPVLGFSPEASPRLKLNFSFSHLINKHLFIEHRCKNTTAKRKTGAMAASIDPTGSRARLNVGKKVMK